IRVDRYRRLEVRLLPAARGFIRKRHGAEHKSGGSPQMADVRPAISGAFVKAYGGNGALRIGTEFQADLCAARIGVIRRSGNHRVAPKTAWTRPLDDRDGNRSRGDLSVPTIINRAAPNCYRTVGCGRPVIAPGAGSIGPVPRNAAVER